MRARLALAAVGVAGGLVAGGLGPIVGAGPAGAAPVGGRRDAPIEIERLDGILDGVPIEETAATRRATDRLAAAHQAQGEAALRWLAAQQAQLDLAVQTAAAEDAVRDAEARVVQAKAESDRQAAELRRRADVTRRRRAELAVEQDLLRTLSVAAFTSTPADELAGFGTFDQMAAPHRREAVRGQVLDKQAGIVDAHERVWRIARGAEAAQRRRHGRAVHVRKAREVDLVNAITTREGLRTRLHEAEATRAARQTELDRADRARHRALVDRRRVRLTRDVAGLDVPLVALHAYWRAAETAPCRLPWWLLAGVGRVESFHGSAHGSRLTAAGDTTVGIIGIPLDGTAGTMAIPDSDGGRLDGDPVWDRAVGPMQFIPGTWGRWARDADGDRRADPHNLYDAASAAAAYLCFSRGDLLDEGSMRAALLAYNRSGPYGSAVLGHGGRYRGAGGLPDVPPDPEPPTGP